MQRLTHRRKPLLRHHMINVVWVQLDGVERVRDWTDWLVDEANHLFVFGRDDVLDVQQLSWVVGLN